MASLGFQTNTYPATAAQPLGLQFLCTCFVVEAFPTLPTGNIEVETATGKFQATPGRVYKFDVPTLIKTLSDSISEDITITYGFGIVMPAGAANGFTIPVPLPIQGTSPSGTITPNAQLAPPVSVGMTEDQANGTSVILPLQTLSGTGLVVEEINTVGGFVINTAPGLSPASKIDTRFHQFVRLGLVSTGDAPLVLNDQFGDLVAFRDMAGNLYPGTINPGVIALGTILYVPVGAMTALYLTSPGETIPWDFHFGMGPQAVNP